jgi:hypothetical protein
MGAPPRPPRFLFILIFVLSSIKISYKNPNHNLVRFSCIHALHAFLSRADFPLFMAPLFLYFRHCFNSFKTSSISPKIGLRQKAPNTDILTRPKLFMDSSIFHTLCQCIVHLCYLLAFLLILVSLFCHGVYHLHGDWRS